MTITQEQLDAAQAEADAADKAQKRAALEEGEAATFADAAWAALAILQEKFDLQEDEDEEEEDEADAPSDSQPSDSQLLKPVHARYLRPSALVGGATMVHPTDLYYAYKKRSTGRQGTISVGEGGRYTRTTSLALLMDSVKGFKANGYNEQEIATIMGTVLTNGGD
jgi:hypothetical protein